MAADPMYPDLSGSSSDVLKSLLGYLTNRSVAADSQAAGILNGTGPASAFTNAIANQNTATGLSPAAMAALRTQATSTIPTQYDQAAQAINTQLLRRGAAGGGPLPSSGGDISRAYQPLYAAMEASKTKATRDTILADEEAKQKSLYQNQQLALQGANSLYGNATSMFNAGTGALGPAPGIAQALADMEPASFKNLLLTSLLSGLATGKTGAGLLGGLVAGGGTNGTGKFGVLGDLLGKATGGNDNDPLKGATPGTPYDPGPSVPYGQLPEGVVTATSTTPQVASGNTALEQALAASAPAIAAAPELMAALGSGLPEGIVSASSTIPALAGAAGAGVGSAAGTGAAALDAALAGSAPIVAAAPDILAAGAAAPPAAGGGLGATVTAALPWALPVAGAVLGAVSWVKSQAHWEANTWTQGFQKPFDDKMASVSDSFFQAADSGQMTKDQAIEIRNQAQEAINGYLAKLDELYRRDWSKNIFTGKPLASSKSDNSKVAAQSYQTFLKYYGEGGQDFLNRMDQKIMELPG